MAWSATIRSVSKADGNVVVLCDVTNGSGVETVSVKGDDLTEASIGKFLGNLVASRDKRNAAFDALKAKEGQPVTIVAPLI